ncbi:phage holin family protein [Leptospira sp. GIMC2001]|uniref:phage holin family protein n=1 Tax=Leptospira sp. GIMC2001 TaxID=1513297 RepID=UPI002349EE5D|nr:phage holin family protein [Leptospira sp. GIMC2001]WCL49364.1 phage holin family protein [Leptospira sp. GIMC2001]
MVSLILSILLQAAVVWYVFPWINSSFHVNGQFESAVVVVLVFILLNWIIRKLFFIFTLGIGLVFYYLSLGLLGLVANAVVLLLIAKFFPKLLSVPDFGTAFLGGLSMALAALVMGHERSRK